MPYDQFLNDDILALGQDADRLIEISQHDQALQQAEELFDPILSEELKAFSERIQEGGRRIKAILDDLPSGGNNREEIACYLVSTAQVLDAEVQSTQDILAAKQQTLGTQRPAGGGAQTGVIQSAISWVKQHVVPILKKILAKAWQILSGLLTPKRWKVKGGVSTSFLGLANADLEITFVP